MPTRAVRASSKRVHGPSREEYQHVLLAAERLRPLAPWLPEVVRLVAEFGLRPGEVFSLPWSSVDWTHQGNGTLRGCVYVEEQKRSGFIPKMGKRQLVPMSPRGREVLQTLLDRAPAPTRDDLVVPNHKGLPYIRSLSRTTRRGAGGLTLDTYPVQLRDPRGVPVNAEYVAFNVTQNGRVEQLVAQRVLLARLDTGDLVVHESVVAQLEDAGFDGLEFDPV